MEEKNIRQILKRYLLGNAEEQDIRAVDNWYASFEAGEPVVLSGEEAAAAKLSIWEHIQAGVGKGIELAGAGEKKERDAESDLSGIGDMEGKDSDEESKLRVIGDSAGEGLEKEEGASDNERGGKVRILPRILRVAAMILLIAGAAVTFLIYRNRNCCQVDALSYTTYNTGVGEKKKISFKDGSVLTLNVGTTIRLHNDFSTMRKVELLDGEVFFDVKKDQQSPFIVESEGLVTTVLGTSFNISAYSALNNLSVGVVSGKVRVGNDSVSFGVLVEAEEMVYNKQSKAFKKIPLDESMTAWQDGRLLLNDLSFDEMAVIIKKNYGIELVAAGEAIKKTRYTTELLAAMTPVEAVEVLAAIHNLKFTKKGSTIFLHK